MSKILVIGDLHFTIENIMEAEEFIEKTEKILIEKKIDLIIVLGDLLHDHERLHTIPLNKICNLVNILRKVAPTFLLVGNHDMINHKQFLSNNHWMNFFQKWDNVTVIDKTFKYCHNDICLIMVPYVPNGMFIKALDTVKDWKNANLIFCHQEFYGCKMGAIISENGDKWDKKYPSIISGHIHSRQYVEPNIYYIGSAIQQAFGESEDKVISIITVNKEKYEEEAFDLKLPKKKIIYMDVNNIEKYEKTDTRNKIKITVSGTKEQFLTFKKSKKYKELVSQEIKIIYKHKKSEEQIPNIENKDGNFEKILYDLVIQENNNNLISDYNYIIKNMEKDAEILLIN